MFDLFAVALGLLLLAFFLRIDFVFYIVYLLVGVYLWSRWATPRILAGVTAGRHFNDHTFWGEPLTVSLVLRNEQPWPIPWLQVAESVPPVLAVGQPVGQVVTLPGRNQTHFTYQIRPTRRGYYRLGPLRLQTGDLFGWHEFSQELPPAYLTVYPRITPLARLGLPSRLPYGSLPSRQRLFEDPARPVGVRDYQPGDSLRQINWKASAHNEQLLVRRLQPAISLETVILLNLNVADYQDRYDRPEWAIEVAASIASHLVGQRQAVGLMSNGFDPLQQAEQHFEVATGRLISAKAEPAEPVVVLPRPGRDNLMKILERLARLEKSQNIPFAPWLPNVCLRLSWGVTLVVITPQADEALSQALHRLVRAGLNPVLLIIEPIPDFSTVRSRARKLGYTAIQALDRLIT